MVALNEEKSTNIALTAEEQKLNDREKLKHYVLKIVYKEHAIRESAVAKVLNEAKMLSEMPLSQHPFIPRLVSKFQTNDALVMVMEKVTAATCDLW